MKRFAAVMTALLLLGVLARPAEAQVDVGLLGGVTFATFGGEDVDEADPERVTGFNIGALAQVPVAEIIELQPEVHYVQKGAEFDSPDATVTFSIDYVEIPLLVRVNVPTESRLVFGFLLGPEVAFKVSCEVQVQVGDNEETVGCEENVGGEEFLDISSFDYGLIFGGSVGYEMSWGELFLNGRYDLGLASIDASEEESDIKNRTFSVLVGFTVPLGVM